MKLSKILRNTIWQGIKDTHKIIWGDHGIANKMDGEVAEPFQYGVADVFVFPLIAKAMNNYGFPVTLSGSGRPIKDDSRQSTFRTLIGIIGLILEIPRLILASVLTLMAAPIVLLVHLIKFPYVYYYQHKLSKMEGTIYEEKPDGEITKTATLGEFIESTQSTLNELDLLENTGTLHVSSQAAEAVEYVPQIKAYKSIKFFKAAHFDTPTQTDALEASKVLYG